MDRECSDHIYRVGRRQYGLGANGIKLTDFKVAIAQHTEHCGESDLTEVAARMAEHIEALGVQVVDLRRDNVRLRRRAREAEKDLKALLETVRQVAGDSADGRTG